MKLHKAKQLINDYFNGDLAIEAIATIRSEERVSCEQKCVKQLQ